MIMTNDFDDELKRMDELEQVSEAPINKALSLEDAISDLELRNHPTVQSGSTLQSILIAFGLTTEQKSA